MSQFYFVSEQVDRITTMAYIASVDHNLYCSELVLDATCEEPLPEVCVDVEAFVADYEEQAPLMIPLFDFLFPQEEVDERTHLYNFLFPLDEEAPRYARLVDDYVHMDIVALFAEDVERRLEADEGLALLDQKIYDHKRAEWEWEDRVHSDNCDIKEFMDDRAGYTESA